MDLREATGDEVPAVCNVLDGAALATDVEAIRASVERGETLVAVTDAPASETGGGTVVGALVRDGDRIAAVAVRRGRRGQGIASALVTRAAADRPRLTAEFDADVRPFYDSLGFDAEPTGDGRLRGVRD